MNPKISLLGITIIVIVIGLLSRKHDVKEYDDDNICDRNCKNCPFPSNGCSGLENKEKEGNK